MTLYSRLKIYCHDKKLDCRDIGRLCKAVREKDFPERLIEEFADYLYTVGLINVVRHIMDERIYECFIYLMAERHKNLSQETLLNILGMTLREYHHKMSVDTFCKILNSESAPMVTEYLRKKIHNYKSLDLIFKAYMNSMKDLTGSPDFYNNTKLSRLLSSIREIISTCLLPRNLLDNLIPIFIKQCIIILSKITDGTRDADIERAKGYRCVRKAIQEILEKYRKQESLYYKEETKYNFIDKEDKISFAIAKYPNNLIGYSIITDSGYALSNRIRLGDASIQTTKNLVIDNILKNLFSFYRQRVNEGYSKITASNIYSSFLVFEDILKYQMPTKEQVKLILDSLEQEHVRLLQEREYYPFSETLETILGRAREDYGIGSNQQKQP